MSSVGYIYTQDMNEESSATQGPFYVTNTLRIEHPSIKVCLTMLYRIVHCVLFSTTYLFHFITGR